MLKLLAAQTSLSAILEELVRHVETVSPGTIGNILFIDDESRLRHGATVSLPDHFNQAIDGIVIGENVGSCGRAAFIGSAVFSPDLLADPNWLPVKDQVVALGLRTAWSMPVISTQGKVLATFGLYFRELRPPTTAEISMVEFLAQTAAIAIELRRAG